MLCPQHRRGFARLQILEGSCAGDNVAGWQFGFLHSDLRHVHEVQLTGPTEGLFSALLDTAFAQAISEILQPLRNSLLPNVAVRRHISVIHQ